MSVWNRLFGRNSNRSARSSRVNQIRLNVESLESREVPATLGTGIAMPNPTVVEVASSRDADAPTEQVSLNFVKIDWEHQPTPSPSSWGDFYVVTVDTIYDAPVVVPPPASDYLLRLDGIPGESRVGAPPPAADYLLKLDGIKGEVRSFADHRGQIDLHSWSLPQTSAGSDDVIVDGRIITAENPAS